MDILTAIFGNYVKVKILRLFLFNPTMPFFVKEIVDRSKSPATQVRKELSVLVKADIIKKKHFIKELEVKRGKKTLIKKLSGTGYILNDKFAYLDSLKTLLTIASIHADEFLAKRFNSVGRVKLVVASGVFTQNWDARVDLLIVGDELNLNKIEHVIKGLESEVGKEVAYSAFETADFEYRLGIHDRLIRDILDYPHITVLDRLGVEPR